MCIDDFCLFSVAFMSLIISLMSSQYAQRETIPKEKFDYAWYVTEIALSNFFNSLQFILILLGMCYMRLDLTGVSSLQ